MRYILNSVHIAFRYYFVSMWKVKKIDYIILEDFPLFLPSDHFIVCSNLSKIRTMPYAEKKSISSGNM